MLLIDGSFGEGGGQILRTGLGLALFTGKAVKIENIRAGRKKPGLLYQHLTAVKAAQEISMGRVSGAEIKSRELVFYPGKIKPGNYRFAIGTAGSATLVLQTILPALLTSDGEWDLTFAGGTHNPFAPPFDFLKETFFGVLEKMGAVIQTSLVSYGFYPAGGGQFRLKVKGSGSSGLKKISLEKRGQHIENSASCIVSKIPFDIAADEAAIIARQLDWDNQWCKPLEVKSHGPGNIILIKIKYENITMVFTGFGQKGISRKTVAENAVKQVKHYLEKDLVVDQYLADQLLVPMTVAGGGSFITGKPSLHTRTNIEVIRKFTDREIQCRDIGNQQYRITIQGGKQ
ncbi:MAG: RNA 3'-terminal phosphate cyclase [Candidatus Aminicenantes bacterium]|jgi:RNA 3'-terminal phosphate cyclase (ATP)